MNSIMNKTQIAEKRCRDRLKKHKKEIRLNTKKHQKQKKPGRVKKILKNTTINYRKRRSQQHCKRKNYMK